MYWCLLSWIRKLVSLHPWEQPGNEFSVRGARQVALLITSSDAAFAACPGWTRSVAPGIAGFPPVTRLPNVHSEEVTREVLGASRTAAVPGPPAALPASTSRTASWRNRAQNLPSYKA